MDMKANNEDLSTICFSFSIHFLCIQSMEERFGLTEMKYRIIPSVMGKMEVPSCLK